MSDDDPELRQWAQRSQELGVPPRCPIAFPRRCPRFYRTFSLMADAGLVGKMGRKEDNALSRHWEQLGFLPLAPDDEPCIVSNGKGWTSITGCCPELAYRRFGVFAEHIDRYSSEQDEENAHRALERERVGRDDWRWLYWHRSQRHYTECPEYSAWLADRLLVNGAGRSGATGCEPARDD